MNIEDIKAADKAAGRHFFSPDTLRFFRSRIGTTVYGAQVNGEPRGQYFITSEQFDCDSPRLYTVRRYDPGNGCISDVGGFQAYRTSQGAAKRAIRERDNEQARASGEENK